MGLLYLLSSVMLLQGVLWTLDGSLSPTGCSVRVLVLCATLGVVALAGEAIRWYAQNATTTKELEDKERENEELRKELDKYKAKNSRVRGKLVACRVEGSAAARELSVAKSSCATKDTRLADLCYQLAQFTTLLKTYGVSSAAELGEVIKLSKASCRQLALTATVYRGMWRATRTRLSASDAALRKKTDRCSTLESKYSTLDKKHLLLNRDYKTLNIQHKTLQQDFARLQSDKAAVDAALMQTRAELSTVRTTLASTEEILTVSLDKLVKVQNEKQQQEAESAQLAIDLQQRLSTTQAALTAEKASSSHLTSVNSLLQQQVLSVQDTSAANAAAAAADDAEASAKTITALGIVVQQQAETAAVERCAFQTAIGQKNDNIAELADFTTYLQNNWEAEQQQALDQYRADCEEKMQQREAHCQETLRCKDEEMALALQRKDRECAAKQQQQNAEWRGILQQTKSKGYKALEAARSGCESQLQQKEVDCQSKIQVYWQEQQGLLRSKDVAYQKLLQENQKLDKDNTLLRNVADSCFIDIHQLAAERDRAVDNAIALNAQLDFQAVELQNLRKSVVV